VLRGQVGLKSSAKSRGQGVDSPPRVWYTRVMDSPAYDFRAQAEEVIPAVMELLRETVTCREAKLASRLKAAEMLLNRTYPTLKSIEIKSVSPVNIVMVSPVAQAKQVLQKEQT